MRSRNLSRAALLLSAILYAASLTRDAFCVAGNCSDWPGWSILVFGLLAIDGTAANMSWFANPLLFVAWIAAFAGRAVASVILGLVALAVGSSFLFQTEVITNEGGLLNPITGLKEGYWLWLTSMALACIAGALAAKPSTRLT